VNQSALATPKETIFAKLRAAQRDFCTAAEKVVKTSDFNKRNLIFFSRAKNFMDLKSA
jgi:hypothetical protein